MNQKHTDATRSTERRPDHATDHGTGGRTGSETGSVWWAELALGAVCALTAAVVVLTETAVGPFASLTVTYGPALTLAYLGAALAIGLGFLASGLRQSPYVGAAEGVETATGSGREA